ncbi:hypothetical protein [Actinacidiphila glaucinigra]
MTLMMADPYLLDTPRPTPPPAGPVKLPLPQREPGKTLRHDDNGMPAKTPAGPPKPGTHPMAGVFSRWGLRTVALPIAVVVEMADHSINGDYGHEPIPTPPPAPPAPAPSGSARPTDSDPDMDEALRRVRQGGSR